MVLYFKVGKINEIKHNNKTIFLWSFLEKKKTMIKV